MFRDFRDANVLIKPVNSICGLWTPWGDRPSRSPLNPNLSIADWEADNCCVDKEIPSSFGTQILITVIKTTRHSALSWAQ
jgi:hypothetical protein